MRLGNNHLYGSYTPAVYDQEGNYKYTGANHLVKDDGRTLCGRIDTRNHMPGTGTYDTGYSGFGNDCGLCERSAEKAGK